jgi:hypothetical protein
MASLLVLSLAAKVAFAGAIADQFSSGYGGVPWGMTLNSLVGLLPGGDHYFSIASGRIYSLRNSDPLFGVPRENMRVQYYLGADNGVEGIAVAVPYERREQLLGVLIGLFGAYARTASQPSAIIYTWRPDHDIIMNVRASREPTNGILEFWLLRSSTSASSRQGN